MHKNIFVPLLFFAAAVLFTGLSCKAAERLIARPATPTPGFEAQVPSGASPRPQAAYLGQDGGNYAGKQCSSGNAKDNIHLRLSGLRQNEMPVQYRLEDGRGGVWANPCDPVSNWLLFSRSDNPGEIDLYFKPYAPAPKGTYYTIILRYADGVDLPVVVESTEAVP